jgi:hypothetical protein
MATTETRDPTQTSEFRIGPAPGILHRRVPELAVGVLLIGLGALGVLALTSDGATPTSVVVMANDVARGDVVQRSDMTFVGVTADAPITVVPAAVVDQFVGMTAIGDLPAGSLLAEFQLIEEATVPPGFAVVGMRLVAGAYPSARLVPGDRLDVMRLPASDEDDQDEAVPVAVGVEVLGAISLGVDPGSDMFLSLLVPAADTGVVAAAAGADRIWLGEVAG